MWSGLNWLRTTPNDGDELLGSTTRHSSIWCLKENSNSLKRLYSLRYCARMVSRSRLFRGVSWPFVHTKLRDMRVSSHGGGRAIAQAVSRWLPTAAARVRARVWSSGICGGQSDAGAGFLRVLRFPLPIFIPPLAPQSPSPIIWGCTIGQKWPQYLVT
jgi:hypothetical protein